MKIILAGYIFHNYQKKIWDNYSREKVLYKRPTIYSKPLANIETGRLLIISKCKENWCKIKTENYSGWVKKDGIYGEGFNYFNLIFEAQNLSNKKYQTVLASGSTIASVKAIMKKRRPQSTLKLL